MDTSEQAFNDTSTNYKDIVIPTLPPQGMSRAKDVLLYVPFSRTTLHEWSRDGRFPKSIRLSPTIVAWRNLDVIKWLESYNSSSSSNKSRRSKNEI